MYSQLLLDNQLCFRLYTAARLVAQAYNPYFEQLGITYPQYLVLLVLWEKDEQLVNDIAHRLYLQTNTVTPLLQRMEKEGLLVRRKGTIDTRQRLVCLTNKGREMEELAKNIPLCMSSNLNHCFTPDDDPTTLFPILDHLIEGLSNPAQSTESE